MRALQALGEAAPPVLIVGTTTTNSATCYLLQTSDGAGATVARQYAARCEEYLRVIRATLVSETVLRARL